MNSIKDKSMAKIKIIPSVKLYKTGIKTTQANGSINSIALKQGSLDGACAVYSTIITLMCLRQINYEDVISETGNIDKRSPKGKFLSKLLEQRGMNMLGWNLKTMAQEINNTSDFKVKATAVRKDFIDRIYDNAQKGFPSILGITFSNQTRHAIVCIGIEESDGLEGTPTKLFCIDPSYAVSYTAYWNCVIMLPKQYDDDTDFFYVVENDLRKVKVDDAIIFD